MINTKKQGFYTLFIVVGAGVLLYDLIFESETVYLKIVGLVVLMFGLYSSTRQWATDNDRNNTDTDDASDELEKEEDNKSN